MDFDTSLGHIESTWPLCILNKGANMCILYKIVDCILDKNWCSEHMLGFKPGSQQELTTP